MSLAIVASFKNEAVGMREWLTHYVGQGVAAFYLINNGSTDAWQDAVDGFWDKVKIIDCPVMHNRTVHFENALGMVKTDGHSFVSFLDLDEYMFVKDGSSLLSYCQNNLVGNVGAVRVQSVLFGSSGHVAQPESIRKSFVHCNPIREQRFKSLLRVDSVTEVNPWTSKVSGESHLDFGKLQVNHYIIQSRDWYMNVKTKRGDPDSSSLESMRDAELFARIDNSCSVVNRLLSNMV